MLDTNILSDALRNPFGKLAAQIDKFRHDLICTSAIVASEMRYGAAKKGSQKLVERVEAVLSRISIVSYDAEATVHYAAIRTHLEMRGEIIGWGDLFIAAHARSLGMVLVTNNTREFSRVPGLTLENWLEESA
ncbi:type II toxin-antitoxin system VapC family toxin [Rhizobium sp. 0TCS1.26]|uniref:type II toxin-antitoxin system VapC family toxin n=1 Tax=Rhizobium sp. 0TCS1.26 TaxID=3142623 RepID=UPI003D29C20D